MFIYNVRIFTMEDSIIDNGYVEIVNGKFKKVCSGKPLKITDEDIDGLGKDLYPGFIDAHTHLGIIGDGLGFESDDCNEETDPVTPQLRTIDAINPFDRCFEECHNSGITTVLTSPGSANAVCGQIIALKTAGRRIDDMMIKPVAMKFALGENPKNVYHDKEQTPVTRMATASLIREALFKARRYMEDMEASFEDEDVDEPEYDIKCESLIPLLKRKISAHFHCHRADDICTAIRISKEFNLDCVIVHATEGYKIADILAEEKVGLIVGPVISDRCKPELKELSVKNPYELVKAGNRIALCTDHPVIPVQYLFTSGAVAVKAGLERIKALQAMTINPAKIAHIDDRTGSIKVGKDADCALFSGDPLSVMESPSLVMINGNTVFKKN